MSQTVKLLWGEGQFLCPQHFQRQDAYHEARLHETRRILHPYSWGVRSLRLDQGSLATGVLRLLEVSAVLPDGELYSAPDTDELPPPLMLGELPPGTQDVVVHLALPLLKEHGGNCGQDATDVMTRYIREDMPTADIFSEAAEAGISYLRKSVRLLTDDQPRDAFVSFPLLKLQRTSAGGFEQVADFLPPMVNIHACPSLVSQLRSLLDALQAKAEALYGQHREPTQNIIEFRSGDIASFWLLHTINAGFATLKHFVEHPGLAPERLHLELLRMAGSLLTFSTAYKLADLPTYNHAQPAPALFKLLTIIQELIGTVISARYFNIPLTETKPSYLNAHIDPQRIQAKSTFYLGVKADMSPADLVNLVPLRFKVGAPDDVDNIVLSALPGVTLTHQARVPSAIPMRPGNSYFALEARGTLYERMIKASALAVYVPTGIPDLNIELLAVDP